MSASLDRLVQIRAQLKSIARELGELRSRLPVDGAYPVAQAADLLSDRIDSHLETALYDFGVLTDEDLPSC